MAEEGSIQALDASGLPKDSLGPTRLLELKYIELLEKRIAALESQLSADARTATAASKTANDRIQEHLNGGTQTTDTPDAPKSDTGTSHPNIQFRELKFNKEGVETIQEASAEEIAQPEQPRSKDSPDIVWLRAFNDKDKYHYSKVEIESEELTVLLRTEFAHDPRLHFSSEVDEKITLQSPFEPFVHRWQRLEILAAGENEDDAWKGLESHRFRFGSKTYQERVEKGRADLTALLDLIRATPELKTYFQGLDTQRKNDSITFERLWTIFPPGEFVESSIFRGKPQIFVVKESGSKIAHISDSGREKDTKPVWYLICWSYDWDGNRFNRVPVSFRFDDFQGARGISTLSCRPVKFMADEYSPGLRDKLIARGKRFYELCVKKAGSKMFDYEGLAVSHGAGFQQLKNDKELEQGQTMLSRLIFGRRRRQILPAVKPNNERKINGRVMVDFESYLQHAPQASNSKFGPMGTAVPSTRDNECRCGSCMQNAALRKNQKRTFDNWPGHEPFEDDDQYLICPPRVLGYHLESRTWLELDIEEVKDISQPTSDESFKRLELARQQKELLRDLVQSHTSGTGKKPMMVDLVSSKGKGLVILLHGPPGVGKTLTAESVALMAGKPLFSVSPSDIGLDPAEVEHNLESLFELAARWRAVLLFDEADVFLESRSSHNSDLTRNALVSVLLRVLEYYDGILILTTNRIQQFDIAVQSRVNLGIRYKDLDKEQKRRIFRGFIDQLPDDHVDDKDRLYDLLEDEDTADWFEALNGRQIRNVLFSAASLAMKNGGQLTDKHIRTMARSTWNFQDSIKSIVDQARRRAEVGLKE